MNLRSALSAVASGLLLTASFPNIHASLLAWVALVPLLHVLPGQSARSGFWLGGIAGLAYFAGTVHWVTNSVHYYGHIPLVPASLITLLLCAYLALYPALFGAGTVLLGNRYPFLQIAVVPALWTALELARTYVFSGFPWSLLGYTQYRMLPVIQFADITGVYGVSFLIVLVNVAVAGYVRDRSRFRDVAIAGVLLTAALAYGFARTASPPAGKGLNVSVIQGNIEQDKKWDAAYQAETTSVYHRLTREAAKNNPDVVIWPETATPFYFDGAAPKDQERSREHADFVKQLGVPLLFGSPTYEVQPNRRIVGRNSAFLLNADGSLGAAYHKIHLVPFGEYVPLKSLLFFVEKMVQAIGDFQAGDRYTVMHVRHNSGAASLSTVICYEIIFPDLVRMFVKNGANVITTVTNDAWFGRTAAPYQHFSMAVLRAVENRVPIARAANTGISGFIDAQGNILSSTDIFTEASLTRSIVPGSEKTFYTRFGDIFSYACVILILVFLAFPQRKSAGQGRK